MAQAPECEVCGGRHWYTEAECEEGRERVEYTLPRPHGSTGERRRVTRYVPLASDALAPRGDDGQVIGGGW